MIFSGCSVAFFLMLQVPLVLANLEANKFLPTKICAVKGSLEKHPYAQADPSVTGLISCSFRCHKAVTQGDVCIGAGLDKGGTCYMLRPFNEKTAQEKCPEDEKIQVLVVEKTCENGGVWQGLRGRCQCSGGWVGDRCHRYAHNCSELRIYGYPTEKEMTITADVPNHGLISNLRCALKSDNKKTAYTMIFKNFGEKSYNRTYNDYVEGFFESERFYWLGLKNMYGLSHEAPQRLRLIIHFQVDKTGKNAWYNRLYTNFVLAGASRGYTFDYESVVDFHLGDLIYNLTLGDCLQPVRGMPFSTADHDQDASPDNCAARAGAGWWFRDCSFFCNPLGLKPSPYTRANPDRVVKMAGMKLTEAPLMEDFQKTEMFFST